MIILKGRPEFEMHEKHKKKRGKIMRKENVQNYSDLIITSGEIRAILNNYRIGKKPLAKLLGWGETTIIRYIEGDIPTAEYSSKLRTIEEQPSYYYELLLKNKDKLTNVAFRKSKKAVLEKLMESKISLIAHYMIYLCDGDISPAYIQWLMYYAQAFSLALYDKELIEEDYSVNRENIPYVNLYNSMKNHVMEVFEIPEERLTEQEQDLIHKIVKTFTWYGSRALKALNAYERTNFRISRDKESNRIIAKETIKNYFKEVVYAYNIHSADEIHQYLDKRIMELKAGAL
jgi:hypothetical protein